MVHPEREAAEAIVTAVEHGAASDILVFGESGFELTSVMIESGSAMDGLIVKDFRSLVSGECILCIPIAAAFFLGEYEVTFAYQLSHNWLFCLRRF
jgi:Trk K+ transport system NAD-binding subunit